MVLSCLNMMDFEGKQEMIQNVERNGTLYQKYIKLQQMAAQMATIIDDQNGSNLLESMAQNGLIDKNLQQPGMGNVAGTEVEANSRGGVQGENSIVERARAQAAEATAPR